GSQGVLERAAALLLARPMRYTAEQRWLLYEAVLRVLAEFDRGDMPVVANLDFGHTSPQMVLPFGCLARVDPARREVVLLEAGVSGAVDAGRAPPAGQTSGGKCEEVSHSRVGPVPILRATERHPAIGPPSPSRAADPTAR